MPEFEITTPTGERFQITAPEGATEAQAMEFAQRQMATQQPKQSPVQYLTGGYVDRSTFEAVGGTAGAVMGGGVGVLAGPAAPATIPTGAIVGGALGSSAGSLTYDQVNNILLSLGIGSGEYAGIETALEDAGVSGATDLAFSGAAAVLGPIANLARGGRPILGRVLGVSNEEAANIALKARQLGVDLGIVDVSRRAFVQGSPGILGVIPIIGAPLRRQARVKEGQLESVGEELINELAPVGLLSDLGIDLGKAAGDSFGVARGKIKAAWDTFRESASKLSVPDVFPTKFVRDFAQELEEESFKARIPLGDQKIIGGDKAVNQALADYVTTLKDLPDYLTIEQVRGISKKLNQFADVAQSGQIREDMALIGELKRLVQADIQNIDVSKLPPHEANEILSLLGIANKTTTTELIPFETATAKKLGTFDRNIFGVGPFKAGSKEIDQLGKTLVKLDTPKAVNNLRNVVGDETMDQLARQRIQDAWDLSHTDIKVGDKPGVVKRLFNPMEFEKQLGLEGKGSKELNAATLDALLKTTGVSAKQFEDFIQVAKEAYKTEVADASKFATRRFIMTAGGAGATAAAIGTAQMTGGFSLGALGLAAMARYGASYLASPDKLRLLTKVLDDTQTDKLRRMALARLLRTSMEDE